jgi:hypothetical protein
MMCTLEFFKDENWVFSGFKKGTLEKVTFELVSGATITLEPGDDQAEAEGTATTGPPRA